MLYFNADHPPPPSSLFTVTGLSGTVRPALFLADDVLVTAFQLSVVEALNVSMACVSEPVAAMLGAGGERREGERRGGRLMLRASQAAEPKTETGTGTGAVVVKVQRGREREGEGEKLPLILLASSPSLAPTPNPNPDPSTTILLSTTILHSTPLAQDSPSIVGKTHIIIHTPLAHPIRLYI